MQSVYEVKVREGVKRGIFVFRVFVFDVDEGKNVEIRYYFSLIQSDLDEIKKIFAINDISGDVLVVGDLVYEAGKVYEISIEVIDLGQQSIVFQCIVRIIVEDFGNNFFIVRVNFLFFNSIGMVNVSEFFKLGLVIVYVNVEDIDFGFNGIVICDIFDNFFVLEVV